MTLFILSRINIVRYLEFYRQFRLAGMRFVAARPRITRPTVICNWQPKRYYKSDSIEPSFTLRNPVILEDNNKTVHLLGTAHISETSAREVRKLIKRVQPQQVVVELDADRAARLRNSPSEESNFDEFFKILMENKVPISARLFEMSIRATYSLLRKAGFVPGLEFLAAVDAAKEVQAQVVYGDRHFKETMKRVGKELEGKRFSFMKQLMNLDAPEIEHIFKDTSGFQSSIEKLLDRRNVKQLIAFMRRAAPPLAQVMLDERDLYLTRALKSQPGPQVVGVVGSFRRH
jgi:pheromone shutdown protein TraB